MIGCCATQSALQVRQYLHENKYFDNLGVFPSTISYRTLVDSAQHQLITQFDKIVQSTCTKIKGSSDTQVSYHKHYYDRNDLSFLTVYCSYLSPFTLLIVEDDETLLVLCLSATPCHSLTQPICFDLMLGTQACPVLSLIYHNFAYL